MDLMGSIGGNKYITYIDRLFLKVGRSSSSSFQVCSGCL